MKTLLTLSILLCLWAGFAFSQTMMPRLAEKDFGEWILRDVALLPDGYAVLADISRPDRAAKYGSFHTSVVWKLNRDFQQIWELEFPEETMPFYKGIGALQDRIFLSGYRLGSDAKSETALLTILDSDGNILDHKTYPCAGYNSTEARQMSALPDGTLAVFGEVFRTYGSAAMPWLFKVDAAGNLLWSRHLATGMYHATISDLQVGADGNLWVTGQGRTTRERMNAGPSSGFLARVDVRSGAKIWESLLTEYGALNPTSLAVEPDGQLFATCRLSSGDMDEPDRLQRMRWSADGRRARVLPAGTQGDVLCVAITPFLANGARGYWGVGYKDRHTHILQLDADGKQLSSMDIGSPHFIRAMQKPDGGLLLLCKHTLLWQE